MNRLLITGIPATGKTTIGNHLQDVHGFKHVDMENQKTNTLFLTDPKKFILNLSEPVVITWGFRPREDINHILLFKQHKYFLVWLDGNRWASLRVFLERGTVQEIMYYLQLFTIEHTQIVSKVAPEAKINPFLTDGSFRPVDEVAKELLGLFIH